MKKILNSVLEYVYPKNIKCMACQNPILKTNPYSLCKECFSSIIFIQRGCEKCGKYLPLSHKEDKCNFCMEHEYNFYRGISCIVYCDIAHKIIDRFKYKDKTYIGYYISEIMKEKLQYEDIMDFEYIIPVPIHKKRKKKRGYNQSEIISNNLSKMLGKECINPIDRIKNTKPLYGLKKSERLKELRNSFKENDKIVDIKAKNVLLVDDIFTSGSTATSICSILLKNDVKKIYVMSFASGMNLI